MNWPSPPTLSFKYRIYLVTFQQSVDVKSLMFYFCCFDFYLSLWPQLIINSNYVLELPPFAHWTVTEELQPRQSVLNQSWHGFQHFCEAAVTVEMWLQDVSGLKSLRIVRASPASLRALTPLWSLKAAGLSLTNSRVSPSLEGAGFDVLFSSTWDQFVVSPSSVWSKWTWGCSTFTVFIRSSSHCHVTAPL